MREAATKFGVERDGVGRRIREVEREESAHA